MDCFGIEIVHSLQMVLKMLNTLVDKVYCNLGWKSLGQILGMLPVLEVRLKLNKLGIEGLLEFRKCWLHRKQLKLCLKELVFVLLLHHSCKPTELWE